MSKQQSREIGKFLRSFLFAEGIKCADYPTLTLIRESPPGRHDFIWNLRQLAQFHKIAEAYIIEVNDLEIEDETGTYKVDYLAIVLRKEENKWMDPITLFNIEEIDPGFNEQKMEERAKRVGQKTGSAIQAIAGIAEYL
jgi:hypothetical protein